VLTTSASQVYGVHLATLYARTASLKSSVSSLAHHFLPYSTPGSTNAYKIYAPSGPCYELAVSGIAIVEYLKGLTPVGTLDAAYEAIALQEHALLDVLLGFLNAPEQHKRGVRIVGESANNASRDPTVSFVVRGDRPLSSREVVAHFDKAGGVGIRFGHFYAYTLVSELEGMQDVEDGVVRISLVHYNTLEEVKRIVELLKEVLA
jgi:selenocysteine lyase/cysteine desulfurase